MSHKALLAVAGVLVVALVAALAFVGARARKAGLV